MSAIPGTLSIRAVEVQDLERLRALSIRTFRDTFATTNTAEDMALYLAESFNEAVLREEIRQPDARFFFACEDHVPIAYMKLQFHAGHEKLGARTAAELARIYVLQEFQSKKVGLKLMQYAIELATREGCEVLWLGVWEHNHKARRFYERLGFSIFGDHEFVLGKDIQTDLLMVKTLTDNN